MTRQEKILNQLSSGRLLCDDCLSSICNIKPRQSVNQACRKLHDDGTISRIANNICEECRQSKITNSTIQKQSTNLSMPLTNFQPKESPVLLPDSTLSTPNLAKGELHILISKFIEHIIKESIEIYNEFSLQHELGFFLKKELPDYLIQFERNVKYFSSSNFSFTKREIDIVVFSKSKTELKYAIELKYPKNGQYPETMYNFCKDIAFIEELKIIGFAHTALLIVADDRLFYESAEGTCDGIYGLFRCGQNINGRIEKPTGSKKEHITIKGSHVVSWSNMIGSAKYAVVEV